MRAWSAAPGRTKEGTMADAYDTVDLGAFEVHRVGYGTMQLTGAGVWGPPSDRAGAIRVLRRAVDLGVDLIDTADSYGPDIAEELIREALHPYPPDLVLATKAGFLRPGPDQWEECGRPEYLKRQCEGSLQRLGVDHIDLFQLHRVDPRVPAEDQYGALKELRDAGQVAEVGLSEVSVADIEEARRIVPVATVQNQYNIASEALTTSSTTASTIGSASSRGSRWVAASCPGAVALSIRLPARWAQLCPRCAWPGCSVAPRSWCPSRARRRSTTSRRTAGPARSRSPTSSMRRWSMRGSPCADGPWPAEMGDRSNAR